MPAPATPTVAANRRPRRRAPPVTVHVALLRAVNLGSHNQVGMAPLRDLAEQLGLQQPRTLLQSGNLVFEAPASQTSTRLEALLEKATREHLGVDTNFFVRTAVELEAIVASNPFPAEARQDPGHLVLMFLKAAPSQAALTALREAIPGRERVQADGRHAYLVYPDGIGRSRLTNLLLEKKLGTRSTGRNWNTVLKLAAMAGLTPGAPSK